MSLVPDRTVLILDDHVTLPTPPPFWKEGPSTGSHFYSRTPIKYSFFFNVHPVTFKGEYRTHRTSLFSYTFIPPRHVSRDQQPVDTLTSKDSDLWSFPPRVCTRSPEESFPLRDSCPTYTSFRCVQDTPNQTHELLLCNVEIYRVHLSIPILTPG